MNLFLSPIDYWFWPDGLSNYPHYSSITLSMIYWFDVRFLWDLEFFQFSNCCHSNTLADRFLNIYIYTDRSGRGLSQDGDQIYSLSLVRWRHLCHLQCLQILRKRMKKMKRKRKILKRRSQSSNSVVNDLSWILQLSWYVN